MVKKSAEVASWNRVEPCEARAMSRDSTVTTAPVTGILRATGSVSSAEAEPAEDRVVVRAVMSGLLGGSRRGSAGAGRGRAHRLAA